MAIPVAAAAAVVLIVLLLVLSPTGMVVVQDAAFQFTTPPSTICPFPETGIGPPVSFEVQPGALFNVSWQVGCEPYGPGNMSGAEFAVISISSVNWPFHVVGSNVPAVFGYDRMGWFNVTLRAPAVPLRTSLQISVTANAWSGP